MISGQTGAKRKQYVEVVACHGIDGSVSPQTITIIGGETFTIQSASQPKQDLGQGGSLRYRVRIRGKDRILPFCMDVSIKGPGPPQRHSRRGWPS